MTWNSDMSVAPRDGTPLLLWNGECVIGWWEARREFTKPFNDWSNGDASGPSGYDCGFNRIATPTHWQPLPPPPEETP